MKENKIDKYNEFIEYEVKTNHGMVHVTRNDMNDVTKIVKKLTKDGHICTIRKHTHKSEIINYGIVTLENGDSIEYIEGRRGYGIGDRYVSMPWVRTTASTSSESDSWIELLNETDSGKDFMQTKELSNRMTGLVE